MPDSAIEFHNCDDEEAKAACCIYFLAGFYGVSPENMTHCCNAAKLITRASSSTQGSGEHGKV